MRKVRRCRPRVSNETIVATKQIIPRAKHNWHCTIGFFTNSAPLNVYFILHYDLQGRSHCVCGGGAMGQWFPHFSYRTKQGPRVSVSNIRNIAFYGCLEIIQTRNFTIFTMYATIFGRFPATFHFFKLHKRNRSLHVAPSKKVQYLTLDFLKSF